MNYDKVLQQYFGYTKLKEQQKEIIEAVINKKDVLGVLATGYGKSICFQLPCLITGKSVLVISPLIALMQDQKLNLQKKGINVVCINSQSGNRSKNIDEVFDGTPKIIYVTPEFLVKNEDFMQLLAINDMLCLICLDEAHCVVWGNDFRDSYNKLGLMRDNMPNVPILAVTATATEKIRQDIIKVLKLNKPQIIIGSFRRDNLCIKIKQKTSNIENDVRTIVDKYLEEKVIIYCKTIKETEKIQNMLENLGIYCLVYHAGLHANERISVQKRFTEGECKCIIATIAFGMGVDIPDIRCVIHYGCPKNLEGYYQEIGRAGRDNKESECVMLYSSGDFMLNSIFLKNITNTKELEYQREQILKIQQYIASNDCRQHVIVQHFGKTGEVIKCQKCDNCTQVDNNNKNKSDDTKITNNDVIVISAIDSLKSDYNMRYGSTMLINMLKGSKSKTMNEWMKDFKYFGLLKNLKSDTIKDLVNNLKLRQYIKDVQIKGSMFTVLECTNKGLEAVKNHNKKTPEEINKEINDEIDAEIMEEIQMMIEIEKEKEKINKPDINSVIKTKTKTQAKPKTKTKTQAKPKTVVVKAKVKPKNDSEFIL